MLSLRFLTFSLYFCNCAFVIDKRISCMGNIPLLRGCAVFLSCRRVVRGGSGGVAFFYGGAKRDRLLCIFFLVFTRGVTVTIVTLASWDLLS